MSSLFEGRTDGSEALLFSSRLLNLLYCSLRRKRAGMVVSATSNHGLILPLFSDVTLRAGQPSTESERIKAQKVKRTVQQKVNTGAARKQTKRTSMKLGSFLYPVALAGAWTFRCRTPSRLTASPDDCQALAVSALNHPRCTSR